MKASTRSTLRRVLIILIILILVFFALEFLLRRKVMFNSIASSLYKHGRTSEAARLWERQLDPEDGDPVPEANYAKNAFREGLHSQADDFAGQALKDEPENPILNYDKGNTQYRLEDLDAALESYKKAMLADPHDQDAKSNYELVLNRKGYKKPKPEDEQQNEQPQPQEPKSEYENTLNALDQKESNDRREPARPQEEQAGRWW